MYNRLNNFGYWKIPSGIGRVILEGDLSEEKKEKYKEETIERRKTWEPGERAIKLYKELKKFTGQYVRTQFWNELFYLLNEDEGTNPFLFKIKRVYIKKVKELERSFDQLFIEFEKPEIIKLGYSEGDPNLKNFYYSQSKSYHINCSILSYIELDFPQILSPIIKKVKANEKKIIETLKHESISTYLFLQEQFSQGDITENHLFHFVYKAFFGMNVARFSESFFKEYFKILEKHRNINEYDIYKVTEQLKTFDHRNRLNFSFASKIFSLVMVGFPIYDSEVSKVFCLKKSYNKSYKERLQLLCDQYQHLIEVYDYILEEGELSSTIKLFKDKFGNKLADYKIIDFIFWQLGKLI